MKQHPSITSITWHPAKRIKNFFETTVGEDITIHVSGDYSAPEDETNFAGGFDITSAWLPTDPNMTDISSLFTTAQTQRIEVEGFCKFAEFHREAKENARAERADYLEQKLMEERN